MKKRKPMEMKKGAEKYWRSFYWITNTLESYFLGKLKFHEEKELERNLNVIANKVLNKEAVNLSNSQLDAADQSIRRNVFNQLQLPLTERRKILHATTWHVKYAAVAAIFLLLIGFSYWGLRTESGFRQQYLSWSVKPELIFQTGNKELKTQLLSDGTKVYLNGGSRLSCKAGAFNKNLREVWLEGEAFFEVAKNPEKPFIIHSPDGVQTKVLGTSFNVKAYSELSELVVSVRTGKVKVTKADGQFVQITPDQKAIFNRRTNALTSGVADGELAASWRSGDIVFDHADRDEIRLRIRQEFGKEVIMENNVLSDIHFIASYPAQTNLEQIIKTIALTNGVQYSISESKVIFK